MPKKFQVEDIVLSVFKYFEKEKQNLGPVDSLLAVQKRTALATGLTERTIRNIITRHEDNSGNEEDDENRNSRESTEGRKKSRLFLKDIDKNIKFEIRNTFYDLCAKNQYVTLNSLLKEVKRKEIINISRASLHRLLVSSMGFKYKKVSNRKVLCEKPHVVQLRTKFLREYIKLKEENLYKNFVVLDETWIFQGGSEERRAWTDGSVKSIRNTGRSSSGKRYIVLHAGTKNGFVDNAGRIFASTNNSSDYHDSMNHEYFEQWFSDMLKSLDEPSVIILDNAPYHSRIENKQPTSSWRKHEILDWLTANQIAFEPHSLKKELLFKAREHKQPKKYVIDRMAQEMGHRVLRLPPYHCQFNPVELVWSQAKRFYDNHIGEDMKYDDVAVISMWEKSLEQVTPENWENYFNKVEKDILEIWWTRERFLDEVEPLLILANTGDSSDEFTDTDSDEDVGV